MSNRNRYRNSARTLALILISVPLLGSGCATSRKSDTARTGTEQLLISNAVDQALSKIDFRPLEGQSVFLDEKYLDGVDKNYLIASMRHRALRAGATLVTKPEEADMVVEMRSGGLGTDSTNQYVGVPAMTLPPFLSVPEIRFFNRETQHGTAKIGLVAYDPKSKHILGQGAVTRAQAHDNNWYALGIGPFNQGAIKNEIQAAGTPNQFPLEVPGADSKHLTMQGEVNQAVFLPRASREDPERVQQADSAAESQGR